MAKKARPRGRGPDRRLDARGTRGGPSKGKPKPAAARPPVYRGPESTPRTPTLGSAPFARPKPGPPINTRPPGGVPGPVPRPPIAPGTGPIAKPPIVGGPVPWSGGGFIQPGGVPGPVKPPVVTPPPSGPIKPATSSGLSFDSIYGKKKPPRPGYPY